MGPGEQHAGAEQQLAAGRSMEVSRHDHLRWNSGAISSSVSACGWLSARAIALARLGRGERAERRLGDRLRDRAARPTRCAKCIGDVEPLRQAVEPGRIVVGKALGRRRPPQRLAEQRQRAA